ncbi:DUF2125 domain-containing protein [Terrarubrum flagellatum]|uniref:DUF2125 domain-containing protein n=1 Tax=Terrirubrum flagellatum TaxID=2895980 RepID=UPI00314526BF
MAASRKALLAPPLLLIALGVIWSGYWFVGSHVTGTAIANWMSRESESGRRWTCHGQNISGYPFRFELSCSSVTLEDARAPVTVTAGPLRAVALAYRPNHVIAELDGPAQAILPSGQKFTANWTQLRMSTQISGGRLAAYDSVLEGFRAAQVDASGEFQIAKAGSLETHLRQTPDVSPDAPSFDLAVDGKGVASALIDNLAGSNDPGDLTLRATLTRGDAIGPGNPIDIAERWRLSGGKITVAQLKIARGRIALDATGEFALDDEHRVAGRVEGTAAGFEQLLARGAGALGGLFNIRPSGGAPKGLPFAVTLRDGRVMLGPLRIATLAPLY